MSCFYLSVGLLAGHSLVFKEETANSGCWCIWIHAHLKRRRWFPSKDTFFSTATEMWSARQSSFQLNSNLHVIFCFNFVTSPGSHGRPAICVQPSWRAGQQSVPLVHGQGRSVRTLSATSGILWKADGRGCWGWVWVFPPLGFACQKPFCADV